MRKAVYVKTMMCVVANKDPLVLWDERESVWNNVLANLGIVPLEEIDIVDEGMDVVTERYQKRLKSIHEKLKENILNY